jgi:hypothetical protein
VISRKAFFSVEGQLQVVHRDEVAEATRQAIGDNHVMSFLAIPGR